MRRMLAIAACLAVICGKPLAAAASDLPAGEDSTATEDGSVSENAPADPSGTVLEIPGWGSITQEDIDELTGYTRDATGEYWEQNLEKPMVIIREPDLAMTYDPSYERYRYTLPDGQWIECNIPQGAFCREKVDFNVSENITGVTYYRDGAVASGKGPFQECGSYVMTFWDLNVFGDANRAYRVDYCFTIYSDHHMNLTHIEAPDGMEVSEVLFDERSLELTQTRFVQAMEDGTYHIVFSVPDSSDEDPVSYEMDFIRDTTPPVITFSPEYRINTVMGSEVSYQVEEPSAKLRILRNYVEVELPKGKIPVNGSYRLEVSDASGNTRVYAFSVKAPVQIFNKKMLLIPVILLLAAVLAGAYWRRNMRVL